MSRKAQKSTRRSTDGDGSRTRDIILQEATSLLIESGVEAFSMRKLAERVGFTATAIYFHFPDKQQMLGEVVDRQFVALYETFQKLARRRDPVERLIRMGMVLTDLV
ncbi:MAG: helix-turn-helix domain-containing protein [Pirellulaceae bacterium]